MPSSAASLPWTSWQELAQGRTFHPQQHTGQVLPAHPPAAPLLVHGCHVSRERFTPQQARGKSLSPMLQSQGCSHVPGPGQR